MDIVRDSFAAGLLGREYQFQPEFEAYAHSLVQADNVLIDPYGQVTRRPPLVARGTLSTITVDSVTYSPIDCRIKDFVFSSAQRYLALFTTYRQLEPEIVNFGHIDGALTGIEFTGSDAIDFAAADFDIEFDIKADVWPGTGYQTIMYQWDSSSNRLWVLAVFNSNLLLQTFDSGGLESQSFIGLPSSGEWHSVKIEKAGTAVAWTVDLALVSSSGGAKATLRSGSGATIKIEPATSVLNFDMKNLKLTSAAGVDNLDIPFDDGSGTALGDDSGNSYDGVVTTTDPDFWGSFESPTNPDIGRIVIQNTDGVEKASLNVTYSQLEVLELNTHHSNDTMWITHQNHLPSTLIRKSDTDWSFDSAELNGGPFLDLNENEDAKMNIGLSIWNSNRTYKTDDVVLPGSENTGVCHWIGTDYSFASDSTRLVDAPQVNTSLFTDDGVPIFDSTEHVYRQPGYSGSYFRVGSKAIEIHNWYPYTLLQVTKAFSALVIVGDVISVNLDFIEEGADDGYLQSGTIKKIYTGSVFDYIQVDFGWIGSYLKGTGQPILVTNPAAYQNDFNYPIPDVPEAEKSAWQAMADQWYGGDLNKTRGEEFIRGSSDTGGAAVTLTSGNIAKGVDAAASYKAELGSTNKNPSAAITAFSDAGGGQVTVTSVGHTISTGDSVIISGTTNYNGTFTVANATTDTFEITDTWVADDATGIWINDTYWGIETTPTASNLVIIEATGHAPFLSTDLTRVLYCDKAEAFGQSGRFIALGTSDEFYAIGRIRLITTNTWSGEIAIETSKNKGVDWTKRDNLYSTDEAHNGVIEIEIDERDVLVRIRMVTYTSGNCDWRVEFPDGYASIYTVEEYISATSILARVVTGTETFFQSNKWALGAFGGENGFPATVTIFENRLWYSGSIGEPFKHWGSVVNKYWNFAIGTFALSAIIFEARADSSTQISWTEVNRDALFFGTDFGEYSAANLNAQQVLSAANPPKTDRHTAFGSARIPAVLVGSDLAYISADKKKSRFLTFDGLEQDGYRSIDMTHRAPQVSGSGFLGHVLQRTPYPVLWFWTADGNAVSFTVDREHNRLAWAQHSTANGLIKSLAVVPDANGIDEIYAIVERTDTVLNATGTNSPDVTGAYSSDLTGDFTSVSVSNHPVLPDGSVLPQSIVRDGKPSVERFDSPTFYRVRWEASNSRWELITETSGLPSVISYNPDSGYYPPETGWIDVSTGEASAFTLQQEAFEHSSGDYLVALGSDTDDWFILDLTYKVDGADYDVLFDGDDAGVEGDYSPSIFTEQSPTGSVNIASLNFHIEKFDYSETTHTDNLNGPSEEIITSQWEPTPFSRGPKFLDGNQKFRSARVILYVTESNGGEVSIDGGNTYELLDYSKLTADANGLFTGFVEVRKQSSWADFISPKIRTTGTAPLNVSAIKMPIDLGKREGA